MAEPHIAMFAACQKLLVRQQIFDPDAIESRFLLALGYIDESGQPTRPGRQQNRLALLNLAGRFTKFLQLPMPFAPGAVFFGSMVTPSRFDISGHSDAASGTAGSGLNYAAAFESCVGEAAEFLSFVEQDEDPLIAETSAPHIDSDHLNWVKQNLGIPVEASDRITDWIDAQPIDQGRARSFPAEIILRRPENRRIAAYQAESAGTGAGATINEATQSALYEVIERDAIALWWYGGRPANSIEKTLLSEFEPLAARVRGNSKRPWQLMNITSDLDIPTIAALSFEIDGSSVVAGFSAASTEREAMFSAFQEMCQMELASAISRAKQDDHRVSRLQQQDHDWIARHQHHSRAAYPQFTPSSKTRQPRSAQCAGCDPLQFAISKLADVNLTAWIVNLTRPGIDIPVVRVLVPGLQSTKPQRVSQRLKLAIAANASPPDTSILMPAPI